jgi:hypothetical protein
VDDAKLIEELQEKVREAEEILRRRKDALSALKGKSGTGKAGRGPRANSIPGVAHAALKSLKQPVTLEELTAMVKRTKPEVDQRIVSLALNKYVRNGQYFAIGEDGKYRPK